MKKIAILGSTGSIGKTLIDIIDKDKKNFKIILLSADKNHKSLLYQAKKLHVKNLIITNIKSYKILKIQAKKFKINVFNNYENFNSIFPNKIDYVMSSISGIDGLEPTIKIIKHTQKIAIANKESIICGWNLITRELIKHKTKFVPVDSEHFSLWYGARNQNSENIENIYLTASGGPFFKKPLNKFRNIKLHEALKHPNWKMGKKITIDSATMMNKVYEVIEAKNIFNISYSKIQILIHPKSYVHAILKMKNGLIKIIAHDTTMKIPIFNSLYMPQDKEIKSKKVDINYLNFLNLTKVDLNRYPMIKILSLLSNKTSLYETVIVSANDTLVNLFLNHKISFVDIQKKLFKIIKSQEFIKFKNIKPRNISDIHKLNNYVRLKILKKVYK